MGESPLMVSVVVPCLNRASFLRPTIDSILGQDYPYIECMVVDGGSTDETLDILRSYGDRIRWISEPDRGHADAINKGWRMCEGEVLAWLNADDVWDTPSAVSRAVRYLQSHPDADVAYGQCGRIDLDGSLIGMSHSRDWNLEYAVEHCDHCIPQPAAFIRRSILERVGWLDTAFYQKKDHELWLRIGLVGTIRHVPEVWAHARYHRGLSFDGRTAAPACVQVTRKFFSLPGIPERIGARRRRALSNSFLRGMDYAWAGGKLWGLMVTYTVRAVVADPSNARTAFRSLARRAAQGLPRRPALRPLWVLLRLPVAGWRGLRHTAAQLGTPRQQLPMNLLGDRHVEWSFIAANLPPGPGRALDFGCGSGMLGLVAAEAGHDVLAMDLGRVEWRYFHPRLRFVQADLLRFEMPEGRFDVVINCSAVEHVGLPGRYGVHEDRPDGDLLAMRRLFDCMAPEGIMLLTIPVGRDTVFAPMTRVYGEERLPRLLEGFEVVREEYWIKDEANRWVQAPRARATALEASAGAAEPTRNVYALGCFVLRKPERGDGH